MERSLERSVAASSRVVSWPRDLGITRSCRLLRSRHALKKRAAVSGNSACLPNSGRPRYAACSIDVPLPLGARRVSSVRTAHCTTLFPYLLGGQYRQSGPDGSDAAVLLLWLPADSTRGGCPTSIAMPGKGRCLHLPCHRLGQPRITISTGAP